MAKYRNPAHEAEALADELEASFEQEMAQEPVTVEDATFKKRYGDLRRHMAAKEAELKDEVDSLRKQLSQANTGAIRMPKSEAEVDEWSKQYPDFRATLDAIITKEVNAALRDNKDKLAKLEEAHVEVTKEKAFLNLKKRHPDVEQLLKQNSDFHKWLMQQSKRDIAAIFEGLDVDDASFVIDKYKSQKGSAKVADEPDNGSAARAVRTNSAQALPESLGDYDFSESQIEEMGRKDRKWFERNEDAIVAAARKGRILMDVTGGAR